MVDSTKQLKILTLDEIQRLTEEVARIREANFSRQKVAGAEEYGSLFNLDVDDVFNKNSKNHLKLVSSSDVQAVQVNQEKEDIKPPLFEGVDQDEVGDNELEISDEARKLDQLGILNISEELKKKKEIEKKKRNRPTESMFILETKEKLKDTNQSLTHVNAKKTYVKASHRSNGAESLQGVLINKLKE